MELRFVSPDIRQLDLITTELLVLPLVEGERPPLGSTGLVDYRLGGQISELLRQGKMTGEAGEALLINGRPKLPFDRILLMGIGPLSEFNAQVFGALMEQLLEAVEELGARRAVVELPGRRNDTIGADVAAEILLDLVADNSWFDTWTLIEPAAAQRSINALIRRDQRRQWGLSR